MQLPLDPSGQSIFIPDEIYYLAQKHGTGMLDHNQLTYLGAALAMSPIGEKDAIVVEIGAYQGNASVFMAKVLKLLARQAKILCIDPFERFQPDKLNPQGSYSKFLETVRKAGFEEVCLPLVAFSQDAAPVVPDRIGVLIVDGDHHYPSVVRDLELYAPKVIPGGLIFMDDYAQVYAGVMQAIDEYFIPERPFTILHKTYFVVAQSNPRPIS
jgi:predicted O-methyltransferase YrrM